MADQAFFFVRFVTKPFELISQNGVGSRTTPPAYPQINPWPKRNTSFVKVYLGNPDNVRACAREKRTFAGYRKVYRGLKGLLDEIVHTAPDNTQSPQQN